MQEEPFEYSHNVPYTYRKFSRGIWSQKFTENWQFRIFLDTQREIVFLFQNNVLLWRFFRYLAIGTSYVQDFLLTSRATLRQPFRCPQYILWLHRNFLEGSEVTEVQFFIKKTAFWHTLRFQKTPSISHFFQSFSRFVQYISIGAFWTLLRFIAVKN